MLQSMMEGYREWEAGVKALVQVGVGGWFV